MNVETSWESDMRFTGTNSAGHTTAMDSPDGGSAPTPKELALEAAAGCSAMDVISILRKMRLEVRSLRVEVEADLPDEHPKIFSKIHMRYLVEGDLPEEKLKRAIELSQDLYCGVTLTMKGKAEVTWSYQITP